MLTNFKRVVHFALVDFRRNKGMSVAAIFVLAITILLVTGLFFLQGINAYLIQTLQNKIDITAYFKEETSEEDILGIKDELQKGAPEIKTIEYVSREDALEDFNERHKDNPIVARALSEVGDNPFLPSLNITTSGNADDYAQVAKRLEQEKFSPFIQKVDFSQKRDTIEKVFSLTSSINRFGIALALLLMLVVVMVVFNTIKLVVDASKEEIATQRIVGASSWFVREPFVIEGGLLGAAAFVICFFMSLAVAYFLSPIIEIIMPGFSLFWYFVANMLLLIAIQLGVGVGLGVIASFIVVRKYLKV